MRRRPPRRSTPTPCPAVTACPATPQRRRLLPLTSAPAARRQRKKECVRVWLTRRGSPPHALYRRRSGGQSGGEHARRGFGGAQVSVSEARPVWWTGACRQCHGWWWYLEAVCIYDGCGLPTGLLTTDTHSYDLVSAIVYFVFNCTLVLSLSLNTLLGRILFRDGVAKCKYITHIF
jgi:hypothetical protein